MTERHYAIGADMGGTNIRVALVDSEGTVVERVRASSQDNAAGSLIDAVSRLYTPSVRGIGIGVAGIIDRKMGVVLRSPNLSAIEGKRLKSMLVERFSCPVYIENDANAAAIGEKWLGAGRRFSSFVLLTLGTGIGGGVIHNDRLLSIAAELGHMTVEPGGLRCGCGNTGCLEAFASARAIVLRAIESIETGAESLLRECCKGNFYKITPEDVYNHALEGDALSRDVLRTAGRYLGIGIGNIINTFSPEAIILGGGLTGAWDIYVEEAIREASKRAFGELFEGVEIIPAMLRDDAGVTGAAFLVFNVIHT